MHQEGEIKEYVLSSNETHTVREFVELAFSWANIDGKWVVGDKPEDEKFISAAGEVLVVVDPSLYRPAEVNTLHGDSSKARLELDWKPKTTFSELVKKMVITDIQNESYIQ